MMVKRETINEKRQISDYKIPIDKYISIQKPSTNKLTTFVKYKIPINTRRSVLNYPNFCLSGFEV